MDTESLHTLSAAATGLGVLLAAVGGYRLYQSCLAPRQAESPGRPSSSSEAELRTRLTELRKHNMELQDRLAARDPAPETEKTGSNTPAASPVTSAHAASSTREAFARERPVPIPVKTAPPPALAEWAGSSILGEMIEAAAEPTPQSHSGLGERRRRTIISILRKYADRTIVIHSVANDDASFNVACALKAAFEEAGWHAEGVEKVPYGNPPAGLFITSGPSSPPEDAIIPHEALTTAGFEASRCVDSNLKGGKTVLLVGSGMK